MTAWQRKSWLALAAVVLGMASCGEKRGSSTSTGSARPRPDDVVVQVGAFDFTDRELNEFVPYARKWDKTVAPAFARRVSLSDYWLTKRVVASLLPAKQLQSIQARATRLAEAVAQAGGTVDALRHLGKQFGLEEGDTYIQPINKFAIDIARATFETPVGSATGAIHSAAGSTIIGVVDEINRGGFPARKVISVFFDYSKKKMTRTEIREATNQLRKAPAWIHPYYRKQLASLFDNLQSQPLRPLKTQ